jgi:hypothetical protein
MDHPPRFIRARLFRYQFTHPADAHGAWWVRTPAGRYLPALSKDDPRLLDYLRSEGLFDRAEP